MENYDFKEVRDANYYRIDTFGAEALRKLVSQLIETFLDCPNSAAIVSFTKDQLYDVARAYRDLCVGYRHPRVTSRSFHYRPQDSTLQRLYGFFPKMLTSEQTAGEIVNCHPLNEKKPK